MKNTRLKKNASVKLVLKDGEYYKLNPEVFPNNGYDSDQSWTLNTQEEIDNYVKSNGTDFIIFGFVSRTSQHTTPEEIVEIAKSHGLRAEVDGFEEWSGVNIYIPIEELEQFTDIVLV